MPRPRTVGARSSDPTRGHALVLAFADGGRGETESVPVPPAGVVVGREAWPFGQACTDSALAPRHAEVRHVDGGLVLRMLADRPPRVNGSPRRAEHILAHGDVIRVADTLLAVVTDGGVATGPDRGLIGCSGAIDRVRQSVDLVAARSHNVVVTGETGTGKEVVARLLHAGSGRKGPFIAVNCSTFSEALLASDLFGHVRGAFTGAVTDHPGLFRAAAGGTLLLDELAEIPLSLQPHLLRVLETREVRPVGGTKDIATDVRVVATTNRDLMALVREGRFRSDLYARLAQWTVPIPPVRARREDIPALTRHLLTRCDGDGRRLVADLGEALLLHDWPLNVRGLLNVLSVAVVACGADGPLWLTPDVVAALETTRSITPPPLQPTPGRGEPVREDPLRLDRTALEALMTRFGGRVAAAARHLGVNRTTLYRMLWACEIEPRSYRRRS